MSIQAHPAPATSGPTPVSSASGEPARSTIDALRDLVVYWLDADPAKLTPQTRMVEDLECDSMSRLALAIEIENAFGVELTDEDLATARTFAHLATLVETRIGEKR